MYPILFYIPGTDLPVTTFGVMMFFAFIAGAWIGGKQAERYGMKSELMWDTVAWVAVAGIVGAKLYHVALNWDVFVTDPRMVFDREGLVWYGGLIGGVIAFGLQVRKSRLPIMTMYDATAPALALAYALGRMGCFLVGDDYGRYTAGPLGVTFPDGGIPSSTAGYLRSLGDSIPMSIPDTAIVPVHPTQLYEVALALVMLAVLWHFGRKPHRTGQLFAGFLFLYSIERFFIEFVRAKGDRYVWGLSTSQLVSIALFFFAAWLFRRRGRTAPPAPLVRQRSTMKKHSVAAALIALLIVAGCDRAPETDGDVVAVDTLTVDLMLGAADAEGAESFGRITGLLADDDGRIYVADNLNNVIRVFGDDGAFQFSIGGPGAGPGELTGPCCMAWGPDGNLWIRDSGNSRYNLYDVNDTAATYVRTITMVHGAGNRHAPTTFRGDSEFADIGDASPGAGEKPVLTRHWRMLDGTAVASEQIVEPTIEQLGGQMYDTGSGATFYLYQPFGPNDLTAFGPDGLLSEGMTSTYSVRVTGRGEPQVLTGPVFEGPPLSAAEKETGNDRLEVLAKRVGTNVPGLPIALPERKQPLSSAFFDESGRLWVVRSTADGANREADVWGAEGEIVQRFSWPGDVTLGLYGYVGDNTILGVHRDELGVEYVVRLVGDRD